VESPLERLQEKPWLAGDAVKKTWSFVVDCLTPSWRVRVAGQLRDFFAAEADKAKEST